MNRKRVCDLCGAENPEFMIVSKHLTWYLEKELRKYNTCGTDHIRKHICSKCFLKIFRKEK